MIFYQKLLLLFIIKLCFHFCLSLNYSITLVEFKIYLFCFLKISLNLKFLSLITKYLRVSYNNLSFIIIKTFNTLLINS